MLVRLRAVMGAAVRVTGRQRLAAIVAILLVAVVVVATVVRVVNEPLRVAGELLLIVAALGGAWVALTTTKARRAIAVVVPLAAVVALIVSVINGEGYRVISVVVRIVLLILAVALAKYALGTTVGAFKQSETEGTPVPAATRGVLFMNLKSGGGKAERFHLVDECTRRGIRPVVLESGMDWLQTVRDVAASGVDVLGMAGGDGSQAMVGTVAAELGLPMVVVPAGTRNHLALDLGLDRDDVVGALDAYGEAVERTMDLADVNGHVFVNNVSLGLYAAIVRSPAYRDAKVDTTLATLPQVLGPDSEPFDLRFTGPDGVEHRGAHVIQISNNPYGTTLGGLGSRPRLDTHQLGVIALVLTKQGDAAAFLAALASGHPERFGGLTSWSTPTFEVTSDAPIDIGLDGETMVMDSPLRFSIRPSPVRVRLPKHAIGYSPAARSLGWRRVPAPVVGRPPSSHDPPVSDPPERGSRPPPAARLAEVMEARPTPRRSVAAQALNELAQVDLAVYRAIAGTPTPTLDEPLRRLSGLANHSKLWLGTAAATVCARRTQRAKGGSDRARRGGRQLGPRQPADEVGQQTGTPGPRHGGRARGAPRTDAVLHLVPVGPLGVGVRVRRGRGRVDAGARRTLRGLAAAVAYSRVHTGVHYPGDVIVGSVVGATIGEATVLAARALRRRHHPT